ncbi:carbohydrate porin [Rhodanobacter sp. BL-MT-08]
MASTFRKKSLACALTFAGLGLGMGLAAPQAHAADDLTTSPYLFGDWNGERTRLADEGVTFNLGYGGEAAHNFTGGTRSLTRYTDQWVGGVAADLGKLWGWQGATFRMTITDRNGRNLGADANIGNNQLIQEVYGRGQTWLLTEFSLEQKFFDGALVVKAGRLPVGEDFAPFTCDFENLTFCGNQPGNVVGNYWLNWPTSVWAANVTLNTTKQTYVKLGAYQVNPQYANTQYEESHGLLPAFPGGTTGALIPLEFGWNPVANGLPGHYDFGVWYNTSKGNDLYYDINHDPAGETGLAAQQRDGQYGAYINMMQQITGDAGGRGATLFLNISQADRNTAATDRQINLGVEYKGPFARDNDMIGFALGATDANSRYAAYIQQNNARTGQNIIVGNGNEYVSELFYSWSPIPSVFLRPNLQYILHPGGTSQNSNAFVAGLKMGFTF